MANTERALAALADPTRRGVFERLADGPQAVAAIAHGLPVSRPAVSQHLKVLKEAGLVTDRAEGTRRVYQIDLAGLGAIRAWLDRFWDANLDQFRMEAEKESGPMNLQIVPAPVRKTIRVNASQRHAFSVFTGQMMRWWRPDHHIGKSPLKDVVLEPIVGGRWYEVGEDATVCEWGKVLAWEPPGRVLLAWQLDQDWKYDPDFITELEVRFIAEGEKLTRVELEHRNLERYGAETEAVRISLDSEGGWTGALTAYAAEADQAA